MTETAHAQPPRMADDALGAVPRYCAGRAYAGQQATEERGFLARFSLGEITFLTLSVVGRIR
jgi:hypothetical protein